MRYSIYTSALEIQDYKSILLHVVFCCFTQNIGDVSHVTRQTLLSTGTCMSLELFILHSTHIYSVSSSVLYFQVVYRDESSGQIYSLYIIATNSQQRQEWIDAVRQGWYIKPSLLWKVKKRILL